MNYAISPHKLYSLIHQDAYFIDLRDPYQFTKLHILNFMNIQEEQLPYYMNLFTKTKPIYLICYSGGKAKDVCTQLRNMGYLAFYIEGGFQAFLDQDKHASLY